MHHQRTESQRIVKKTCPLLILDSFSRDSLLTLIDFKISSSLFILSLTSSMPQPPLSALVLFFCLSSLSCLSFSLHLCPPFTSPPSFPFSFSPGFGHPSFQLKCSASNHSLISINNHTFSLLRYEPNTSSLLLSPLFNTTTNNCSSPRFLSIPSSPINLSSSPFAFSDGSCSRLSLLKPCSPNVTNCTHCPWECKLINNPVKLLHGCGSRRSSLPNQGCQSDVLAYLDNFLDMGIELEWDTDAYFSSCRDCKTNKGICAFNSSDPSHPFLCLRTKSQLSPTWLKHHIPKRTAILASIFAVTCFMVILSISLSIIRSRRLDSSATTEEDPTALFLQRHRNAALLPPVFTYEELEHSTNKFDTKRKIGDGGFGSVYLAHLNDNRVVAVKHLHKPNHHHQTNNKSFCNEILILSSIDHPNLVKLHGYCSDPRGLLLVYDYVPNGTLADHLHGYRRGSMTWQVRVDMALQIALVMEYLHFSVVPPVVHRDITSSNIFVEKDMRVKVGDFGLSRLLVLPETGSGYVWTGPQGTPGYLDPDYHKSFRLTDKSDVYSFGVVVLELISGLKAVDERREKRELALADMMVGKIQMGLLSEVVDPVLKGEDGVDVAAELAFRCVAAEKDDRPDAREVVEELKRIRSRT